jgi:hypothetical protein
MMASGPKGQALNDAPSFEAKIGGRDRPFKSICAALENILRLLPIASGPAR